MNVIEINPSSGPERGVTLPEYVALALPLSIVTAWIIIAFQSKYIYPQGTSFFKRLGWPIYFITIMSRKPERLTAKRGNFDYPLEAEYDHPLGEI